MIPLSEKLNWETIPYEGQIDGNAIFEEIALIFDQHLILPEGASTALALWCMNTYVYNCNKYLPKLLISSPTKGCGKTTALEILGKLVNRPLSGANMSKAAIYRVLDAYSPTLIIDEADTFLCDVEGLGGILNAGHSKTHATVWRCQGDNHDPTPFNVFSPQAIGMIGQPKSDTLLSRCILINMKKKTPEESIRRFKANDPIYEITRSKLATWAEGVTVYLEELDSIRLGYGDDRYQDNWEPLLNIANLCSEECLENAKSTAIQLTNCAQGDDLGPMLLEDIKNIFEKKNKDRLPSTIIALELSAMEDRPWTEMGYGKGINERTLSTMLKPFSIAPKTIRISADKTAKGYLLDAFEDAFKRYLG